MLREMYDFGKRLAGVLGFMNRNRVKVWGHRGADGWDTKYAPENTLPSFRKAAEMGADGIELDVQLSRDGAVVVCHDERIDRTSDGSGFIGDYTLAELKHFSFSKLHPEYGFVEIPTLDEVLAFLQEYDLLLNIELKSGVMYYEGLEEKTLALVKKYGLQERVLYSSFNHYSLNKLHQLDAEAQMALLISHPGAVKDLAAYANAVGGSSVTAIHPHYKYLDRNLVDYYHACGLAVNTWTVDPIADMQRIAAMGVDGMITDCPDNGVAVVNEICGVHK